MDKKSMQKREAHGERKRDYKFLCAGADRQNVGNDKNKEEATCRQSLLLRFKHRLLYTL